MKPELITSLKSYNLTSFFKDLIAGIIVGIVALPLAIAFAIASGVSPEKGIFTAIIAGLCIAIFGGSKVQIGGPTGAFVVIVYGIVQEFGITGLTIATIMAGIMLVFLGIFKMGGMIKFIPYPIITGFTAGIAVTIATTQIGDFFGLKTGKMPGDFIGKIGIYTKTFSSINYWAFAMALISLIIILLWPKVCKKIPGSLIILILATIVSFFLPLPIETIGSRYGSIPSSLPAPSLPHFDIHMIIQLFPTATSIAVLAAIESLMSAVVADGMIGSKHNSNMELIAQGIANIASPLFGGIPATGAIARTATNVKNGGRSPIAGIIHALTLLLIMIVLAPLAVYIPLPALAAILMSVAWNMAGLPEIKAMLKGQKSDIAVLAVTFFLTVFIDLTVAIGVGLVLAAFLFIKKIIDVAEVRQYSALANGLKEVGEKGSDLDEDHISVPEGVLIYEIEGPLFFGTIRKFEQAVERSGAEFHTLILRMRNTSYVDAGGLKAMEQLLLACKKNNVDVILSGIHTQPYMMIHKSGIAKKIGDDNICANVQKALEKAKNCT